MPQNPARTARTRAEILDHAARLFRLRGYAGTNIDDVMLAAGLTRGAFYAHFDSKDDLFAEAVRAGHGLLARLRSPEADPLAVLDAYLATQDVTTNALGCTLAALAGDVARAPLAAQLAYANLLHAAIGEIARRRGRRLDAEATAAVILAVGTLALARASGERRLSDWLLRSARRALRVLLRPKPRKRRRVSPRLKRSRSRRPGAGPRRARRAARPRGGRA